MNLQILKTLNPIKTIYFNFKMFSLKEAIKFPVFIGYHTKFISLKGSIKIENPINIGMIRIGFGHVGIFDKRYVRTLIELNGKILFKGKALIIAGSKISVGEMGCLTLGNYFKLSPNSTIICFDSVTLGDYVRCSWDSLIMDTDFHETSNTKTEEINTNYSKPISLGDNTWVGVRCLLLKGTSVPANTIIGANSFLNKKYDIEENCLIAGNPAILKKRNVKREGSKF